MRTISPSTARVSALNTFVANQQHDYLNVTTSSTQELQTWTVADVIADAWMCYTGGKGIDVGGGLTNLAELDIAPSSSHNVLIVSKEGSKVEIRE